MLLLLVVVLCAGYLAVVGVLRYRVLELPRPDGGHPVGRALTDVPAGTPDPDEPRRAVWLWYPADPAGHQGPAVAYAPAGWRAGALPPALGRGWFVQDMDRVRSWARDESAPAPGIRPLIALAPGYGTAPWMYTTLGEDLASRGYIVALLVPTTTPSRVVDGEQRTTPPGGQPEPEEIDRLSVDQAADMTAMVAALTAERVGPIGGHIDPGRVVLGGHSLGGMAAALACEQMDRCAGSVNLDGPQPAPPAGDRAPRLLIASDHSCAVAVPCDAQGASAARVDWLVERHRRSIPDWEVGVAGAGHNSFGDTPFYFTAPPVNDLAGTGDIPADRMRTVTTTVLAAAAADLLATGAPPPLPDLLAELPELEPLPEAPAS